MSAAHHVRISFLCFCLASLASLAARDAGAEDAEAMVVTLGDSITKGVRQGVEPNQTFAALLEERLAKEGIKVRVVNVGIGGERTDQALVRLTQEVIALAPRVVTVMYGTNDSYVDQGRDDSRLSADEFADNLDALVTRLRAAGIRPILMTEPRWGDAAGANGAGEHPNLRLEKFMHRTRAVADQRGVPLVDHYEFWSRAAAGGVDLGDWTTDQCHPNPRGHEELAAHILPVVRDELARAAWKRYRVIFNCDGNAVFKDAAGDTNQWLENLFGPFEGSHVDALFWCDGAGGNTALYKSDVLELNGARAGKVDPNMKRLLDEGNDPPKLIVDEAQKRHLDVFYSFRINDIHDSFIPEEMATFKVEHPEWLLGERQYNGVTSFPTSLNFAVPEVRDLKFRVVEELFSKYDFDGLEIDFLRSAPYFPPGTEAENAHLLTELLKRIRNHLNSRGHERGRPIRLAVRVDESLEACRLDGFDVPAWIGAGLVDIVVLGSGVIDIEIDEFKQLAGPSQVQVYPCLYGWPSGYNPIPAELAAGTALSYWNQGADGIYLFNWFPHAKNNSERNGPYMASLMKLMGDPLKLRAESGRLMFAADRGRPQKAYHHNWMHCVLPAELPANKSVAFSIRTGAVFESGEGVDLTLRLTVDKLQDGDELTISLNGKPLSDLDRSEPLVVSVELAAEDIKLGTNELVVMAKHLSDASGEARVLSAAEVHVRRTGDG